MASRGNMAWAAHAALALTIVLALGACGGDDDGDGAEAGSGGSGAGSGGSGAGSGGSGAGSGGSAGTSTGGTGGSTAGTGGTGGIPMAMCDTSIPTTAECGGTMCPASTSPLAMFTCSVPCCTDDDECGLRNAVQGMTTDCMGPAEEDPSCPGYQGMAMGMMIDLPGCCHESGRCGAISSLTMSCIVSSMFLTDLMPGDPCGDGNDDGG